MTAIDIRRHYEPGIIGRIGELHGRFYADAWGTGAAFEIFTLRALIDFFERYDPARDLFLTAHAGDTVIGSLAVQGRVGADDAAQIRFVIVDPGYHGRGTGKAMLTAALAWCREQPYRTLFLWTVHHAAQTQSRTMYEHAGFQVVERTQDARYSVPLESIKMLRHLDR